MTPPTSPTYDHGFIRALRFAGSDALLLTLYQLALEQTEAGQQAVLSALEVFAEDGSPASLAAGQSELNVNAGTYGFKARKIDYPCVVAMAIRARNPMVAQPFTPLQQQVFDAAMDLFLKQVQSQALLNEFFAQCAQQVSDERAIDRLLSAGVSLTRPGRVQRMSFYGGEERPSLAMALAEGNATAFIAGMAQSDAVEIATNLSREADALSELYADASLALARMMVQDDRSGYGSRWFECLTGIEECRREENAPTFRAHVLAAYLRYGAISGQPWDGDKVGRLMLDASSPGRVPAEWRFSDSLPPAVARQTLVAVLQTHCWPALGSLLPALSCCHDSLRLAEVKVRESGVNTSFFPCTKETVSPLAAMLNKLDDRQPFSMENFRRCFELIDQQEFLQLERPQRAERRSWPAMRMLADRAFNREEILLYLMEHGIDPQVKWASGMVCEPQEVEPRDAWRGVIRSFQARQAAQGLLQELGCRELAP